jgi:hypothetical protein
VGAVAFGDVHVADSLMAARTWQVGGLLSARVRRGGTRLSEAQWDARARACCPSGSEGYLSWCPLGRGRGGRAGGSTWPGQRRCWLRDLAAWPLPSPGPGLIGRSPYHRHPFGAHIYGPADIYGPAESGPRDGEDYVASPPSGLWRQSGRPPMAVIFRELTWTPLRTTGSAPGNPCG